MCGLIITDLINHPSDIAADYTAWSIGRVSNVQWIYRVHSEGVNLDATIE
jgi:hypothetical protein